LYGAALRWILAAIREGASWAPAGYQVKDMADMLKGIGDLSNAKTQ
jgi:hypothetical protein